MAQMFQIGWLFFWWPPIKIYWNFCEMGFQLKKKWQIDNIFKLVLTDKLTFHITFWWKYQQSKLFPFTSCSFHCIFRIHQLNGLLEDIGPCSTFENGWANHQYVSGGTLKKWKKYRNIANAGKPSQEYSKMIKKWKIMKQNRRK